MILFFGEVEYIFSLYSSITESTPFRNVPCRFVDVSQYYGNHVDTDPQRIRLSPSKREHGRDHTVEFYNQLRTLFERERPSTVVIPHELGYASMVIAFAHQYGIPSYQIQHGELFPEYFSLSNSCKVLPSPNGGFEEARKHPAFKLGYTFTSSKIGVGGPYFKRRLLGLGMLAEQIDVTGYIKTDLLRPRLSTSYEQICSVFGLSQEKPLAVYIYSNVRRDGERDSDKAIVALKEGIKALQRFFPVGNILILNHPREKHSVIREALPKDSNVIIAHVGDYLWAVAKHSSLILGVQSAALLEILPVGVNLIVQNYALDHWKQTLLAEYGAALPVFHPFHLEEQMERLLGDTELQAFLKRNQKIAGEDLLGPCDGLVSARTAQAIVSTLRGTTQFHEATCLNPC